MLIILCKSQSPIVAVAQGLNTHTAPRVGSDSLNHYVANRPELPEGGDTGIDSSDKDGPVLGD